MKDKIFKAIKCVLFMLPFVFVGGKTLYTILNDNAKDSYSQSYLRSNMEVSLPNTLNSGFTYNLRYDSSFTTGAFGYKVNYSSISVDWYSLGASTQYNYNYFYIQILGSAPNTVIYLYENASQAPLVQLTNVWGFTLFDITFVCGTTTSLNQSCYRLYTEIYAQPTLDNAFEYSLSEFNDIGFGKINFLEWFNDLFLNNNFNNVYSTFINSYLNYFLFVELVMFIPSVFHWVIHFFTEIGNNALTRSTKKEKGDD